MTEYKFDWPHAKCAVSFTFDVDADVGDSWRHLSGKLSSLSEARYGIGRGLSRLTHLLARHGIVGTFYVPGETAQLHPDEIRALAGLGHEIEHHGHEHLHSPTAGEAAQRDEILRGIDVITEVTGPRPLAYRSPGWELTPYTLDLIIEQGFQCDSSCMGDDVPYILEHGGRSILELPIHWSLDDWMYYGMVSGAGRNIANPTPMLDSWQREILMAIKEGRHVTLTMHPEVIGRDYRIHIIDELIEWIKGLDSVWIASHGQVMAHLSRAGGESIDLKRYEM